MSRPGGFFRGRTFSAVRREMQMKGGKEPLPCFAGYMSGWAAEGSCRVSVFHRWWPQMLPV